MSDGIPFFRGQNQLDGYAASLVLSRLYQEDTAGAADAFSLVDPGVVIQTVEATPAIPAFVILESQDYLCVAITGTQNTTQQILNVVGSPQASLPPIPGFVGGYWGLAALNLQSQIDPTIRDNIGAKRLVIIGHSLGGAIAMILGALYLQELPATPVAVLTIGAPRPGNQTFANAVNAITTRWENAGDPVTALPPTSWAAVGNNWPMSGPPPLSDYTQPGGCSTVATDGTLTPGSAPISTLAAATALVVGNITPHTAAEYARRLQITIPPDAYPPPASGYADPDGLLPMLSFVLKNLSPGGPDMATSYYKVQLFYQYGDKGISEEWYSPLTPTVLRETTIPAYLSKRMSLAVSEFQFLYARISQGATPSRQVDFLTQNDPGVTVFGKLKTSTSIKSTTSVLGSADDDALLFRMKLTGGPSARMFLHAYDGTQDSQGTFTPNANWLVAFPAFLNFLSTAGNSIFFEYGVPVPPSGHLPISAIAALSPRGAKITPVTPISVPLGTVVYIGGIASAMKGVSGRKIVTVPFDPSLATFAIGGAAPIGSYTSGGYFYVVVPAFGQVNYGQIERITSHKTGRPFGVYRGRKSNYLPLRR